MIVCIVHFFCKSGFFFVFVCFLSNGPVNLFYSLLVCMISVYSNISKFLKIDIFYLCVRQMIFKKNADNSSNVVLLHVS